MKRLIVGGGVAVALIFACLHIHGAQLTDPSSYLTSAGAATIPSGYRFILQLDTPLHTNTTKKGDKVEFHTAADIIVDNQVLIPNQSLVRGEVKESMRAGILFGRAELELGFTDVTLPDGTVLPFQASITRSGFDPVDSETGEEPKIRGEGGTNADAQAAVSAGVQGAIIGGLSSRRLRGVIWGAGAGAASSAISGIFRRGPDIDLPHNTMFEARFDKPLAIPEQSVLAQNSPIAADTQTAEWNADPEEIRANGRPFLRRARDTQPIEEASIPSGDAPNVYKPEEEPIMGTRPILKRPQSVPPIEEASVPNQELSPDNPPAVPYDDGTFSELGLPGVNISVKVKMVQVDAVVRDRSGRMIPNLQLEDFQVYEDNVLQEVAGFSQDELPLAVAIVVDHSDSVLPYISELRRIATRALYNLKPQDKVCLFSFATQVQRLVNLTTDRQRIANAIDRIRASGGTNIMDALYEAIRYLANAAPESSRAIILISDNEQTEHPAVSQHDVIDTAQERNTAIYSLKTSGTTAWGMLVPYLFFSDSVDKVVRDTGGEVIKVGTVGSLDSALDSVIARLKTRYSLGYYPSSDSKIGVFHEIKVRLSDKFGKPGKDYTIQAKRGYYAVQSSKVAANAQPLE